MFGCVVTWTLIHLVFITLLFIACAAKKKPQRRNPGPSARSARSGASAQGGGGSRSGSAQPNSNVRSAPSRSSAQKSNRQEEKRTKGKKKISSQMRALESKSGVPDDDYGDVPEPTESAKRRREAELDREKKDKIKKGFYQENSDEDDTLEPIKSLKQEQTEESTKKSSKKRRR